MKQSDIRISLIIPAYNEERHLAACLDAVAAQTVMPYEVIVIDNNSTDKTVEIACRYPFVRLLHEPKQGIVFARNRGFNAAKGTIIGRTDADAILPVDWVTAVSRFYADPLHASYGLTGNGKPYNLRFPRFMAWVQGQVAFRVNRLLLGHYIFYGSNMAIPTVVWDAIRSDTCIETDIHEDLDLAIHAHRAGYQIAYQETLQVGFRAGHVISRHEELLPYLLLWPRSLRKHGISTWVYGWVGAMLFYALTYIAIMFEKFARLFGRPALHD